MYGGTGEAEDPAGSSTRPKDRKGGRQVIPRPADATRGADAPWEGLEPSALAKITLDDVRVALGRPDPLPASTETLPPEALDPESLPAAVLVPLFEEAGEVRVVLTRRAANLRSHRGEVSFPGGRLERGEEPEQGALREAKEEVSLDPGSVQVIGRLSTLSTFSSKSVITPVVGVLRARPLLRPNPSEVEHVFDVALTELTADGVFREERWKFRDRPAPSHVIGRLSEDGTFPIWFFELDGDTVWGATARIIVELLRRVLGI